MQSPLEDDAPRLPIDLHALERRAQRYAHRCDQWLQERDRPAADVISNPLVIVSRLSIVVPTEIRRALAGWLSADEGAQELPSDPEHAAAMVLTAIDHCRDAWLALVKTRHIGAARAEPFVTDLVWLKHEVERAFPDARSMTQRAI